MRLIPKRKLSDGGLISVIGFGGLMASGITQNQVDRVVDEAISAGVNFFDVAPTYGDAEIKLGNSLSGRRNNVLLSCKTTRRDKQGSLFELIQSRKRLKTDYFDFYVIHGIRDIKNDVEPACSKDGVLMTAIEAKKQGIVARIGFSAHTEESAISALDAYDFDFVIFPINIFCFLSSNFGGRIIRITEQKNIDLIGIKSLALGKWQDNTMKQKYPNCWYQPIENTRIARIAISWAISQNIVSFIPPADIHLFETALQLISDSVEFTPRHLKEIKNLLPEITPIFP
ncbi:MAG TPA: aldo/keto reductase [Candidatus Ratteibacteria bacterium]|nr:aldo/keto reductase [Candidatus Ratteibacteria bacterium]HRV04822.1 aldo/keto reductase [Candidatus Ratteibacteria bacterium]